MPDFLYSHCEKLKFLIKFMKDFFLNRYYIGRRTSKEELP